jgi:hypothetical protein
LFKKREEKATLPFLIFDWQEGAKGKRPHFIILPKSRAEQGKSQRDFAASCLGEYAQTPWFKTVCTPYPGTPYFSQAREAVMSEGCSHYFQAALLPRGAPATLIR